MKGNSWKKQRLETAILLFNRRNFFEAHDVLEDIWMEVRSGERRFYQGLLHVAVGFYHYDSGNYRGAYSQLTKAEQKLSDFLPGHMGVDVRTILDESHPFKLAAQTRINGLTPLELPDTFPPLRYAQTENDKKNI